MLSRPVAIVLTVCSAATSCSSLHWPKGLYGSYATEGSSNDLAWSPHEVSTILDKATVLEAYTRKPDCFQRVAGAIRVRCGQLDMNEDERIKAAISMTLCELATANHSPPLECVSAAVDSQSADSPSRLALNSCVEALSRSAQYWSSYSGYLREVPQLCHAFRRWHDIDAAKDTYRNATLEVVSLIRIVQQQMGENVSLQSHLQDVLQRMHETSAQIDLTQAEFAHIPTHIQRLVDTILDQSLVTFRESFSDVLLRYELDSRRAMEEISTNLVSAAGQHESTLTALVTSLEATVQTHMSTIFSEVALHQRETLELAQLTNIEWIAINDGMSSMQKAVSDLAVTSSEAAAHLHVYASQAAHAQGVQREATKSASKLATALAELSNHTRDELRAINETASSVRDQLLNVSRYHDGMFSPSWWMEWSRHGIIWTLQLVFGDKPAYLETFTQLAATRAFGLCLCLITYLLRASLTSLMSAFLLAISLKRWIFSGPSLLATPSTLSAPIAETIAPLGTRSICTTGTPGDLSTLSQTLVLAPTRLSATLLPRAVRLDARTRSVRFSRIPDRLCLPLSEQRM